MDDEEAFAIRSYVEGHIRREKRITKYNIIQVSSYKGFLLPKEPFLTERTEGDKLIQEEHKSIWWMPKAATQADAAKALAEQNVKLDEYSKGRKFIANSTGQRLVFKSDTEGFFSRLLGRLKLGSQTAGICEWMDEPENGWDQCCRLVSCLAFSMPGSTKTWKASGIERLSCLAADPNSTLKERYANKWPGNPSVLSRTKEEMSRGNGSTWTSGTFPGVETMMRRRP